MGNFAEYFKKHTAIVIAAALGLFVEFYLLIKRSQGSSAAANPAAGLAAYTLQEQQLQQAGGLQSAQLQAQYATQQLQANLQGQQVNASLSAQNTQTEAQLIAALAQNQTQAQANKLSAEVTNNQYSTEAGVVNNQTNAQLTALETQAGLYTNYMNIAGTLAKQQAANNYALNRSVIANIGNVGGSQNRVSLLESASGNVPGSIAAESGATASAVSGNYTTGAILTSIANLGSKTVSGLLG